MDWSGRFCRMDRLVCARCLGKCESQHAHRCGWLIGRNRPRGLAGGDRLRNDDESDFLHVVSARTGVAAVRTGDVTVVPVLRQTVAPAMLGRICNGLD